MKYNCLYFLLLLNPFICNKIKNLSITLDSNKVRSKTISVRYYFSGMRDSKGSVTKNFKFPFQGKSVVRFSNPIFSSNKEVALINIWMSKEQGGFDWNNYTTVLLKKKNLNWEILEIKW